MAIRKILFVFGTRPEAIKLAPLIKGFKKAVDDFKVIVCVTAQHREMLDQVLDFFDIKADYDLNVMKPDQDLFSLSATILQKLKLVLETEKPDMAFVHGDTTTTMMASLACFYANVKVGHVEAGLRTFNKHSPFPEEINRTITGKLTDFHFAPTASAKNNLLKENVPCQNILVTGNTVIDALLYTVDKMKDFNVDSGQIEGLNEADIRDKKIILVTGHRRENHGSAFENICLALRKIADLSDDISIIFPVHPNPNVQKVVFEKLSGIKNICLIKPLMYQHFVWLMSQSHIILTDSGGIQEEAPSLKKPVLVMREVTERPEALELGFIKLVGTEPDLIISEIAELLNNKCAYKKMEASFNPYGDGKAFEKIIDFVSDKLQLCH